MLKTPLPYRFKPYRTTEQVRRKFFIFCQYSKQYPLPCANSGQWGTCMGCVVRQQWLSDYQIAHDARGIASVHICDRCGREIEKVDKILNHEIKNRLGTPIAAFELCERCQSELIDWMFKGELEIPDIEQEALEYEETVPYRLKGYENK